MIRRSAASSSSVQAVNDLCLSVSTLLAIRPSSASSSSLSSPSGSGSGISYGVSSCCSAAALSWTSSATGLPASRK